MPLPANTLTDGVVVISPLRWEDAAPHLAGEDAELVRWLNGGPGSRATVHAHVRSVFAKLGVSRQAELAVFILRLKQGA